MQEITYESGLDLVSELQGSERTELPGAEAYKGYHPRQGNIIVVVTAMSGALLITL
jgi:hypothetical protein